MRKKTIGIVLSAVLVVLVTVVVYAAAGGYGMTYLPGTADNVTNMPAGDNGIGGQAYGVSAKVPQREGYEFLGWTLDYGVADTYTLNYVVFGDPTYGKPGDVVEPGEVTDIRAGSNVTLAAPLATAWQTVDGSPWVGAYVVYCKDIATLVDIMPPKFVDVPAGVVTEEAIDVQYYKLADFDDSVKTCTIQPSSAEGWRFTGWCSDEACTMPITEVENITADTTVYGQWKYEPGEGEMQEIIFYYERLMLNYVVRYVYIDYDDVVVDIIAPVQKSNYAGSRITETRKSFEGYNLYGSVRITTTLEHEGQEIVFYYLPHV